MSITTRCRDCGKGYAFRRDRAGQVVRCRECGGSVRVPGGRRRRLSPRGGFPVVPALILVGGVLVSAVAVVAITQRDAKTVARQTEQPESPDASQSGSIVQSSRPRAANPRQDPAIPGSAPGNSSFAPLAQNTYGNADQPPTVSSATPGDSPSNFGGFASGETTPQLESSGGSLEWVPCVDPAPASLISDWGPQRSHRVPMTKRSRSVRARVLRTGKPVCGD